ncbi:signal peptidase I [bacterium]|nr:MAG: signal peptidase I [bacterium]
MSRRRHSLRFSRLKGEIAGYARAILLILFLRGFVIQAFRVPTGSMEDTILIGDFLLVNRLSYGIRIPFTTRFLWMYRTPRKGEIVIFTNPYGGENFVKRCVGLPGDTIEIKHKILYVNGKPQEEPYVSHRDPVEYPPLAIPPSIYQKEWEKGSFRNAGGYVRDNFGPVVVPEGTIFVMGDNRDNSWDSRFMGPIPLRYIVGTPLFIYWSWNLSSSFPGIRWERIGRSIR